MFTKKNKMEKVERKIEVRELICDILNRGSLSWQQQMVLINSLTVLELNELKTDNDEGNRKN